jgi:hypothetical protein
MLCLARGGGVTKKIAVLTYKLDVRIVSLCVYEYSLINYR